jgi:transposase InsO family protein
MGRIDRSCGQDATMERRHIAAMLRHIDEYERVKAKKHAKYKHVAAFFNSVGVCKQNFHKYYKRFLLMNRDVGALLPHKTGRKFKDVLQHAPEVLEKLKGLRAQGYNRYDIAEILHKEQQVILSPSATYRLMRKLNINRLNPVIKEQKSRIIKMNAGELGHVDIHYIAKGTVLDAPKQKFYLLGMIDSYSRVCWLEVLTSIKAIDVMFAAQDILLIMHKRYGIEFSEIMSDNGSEFASKNNPSHPFEKLLSVYNIKHRYTKPCSPHTNGKIERFWRTIEEELLSSETFQSLDDLKHHIKGYCLYYNEHRKHQAINLKYPVQLSNIPSPS